MADGVVLAFLCASLRLDNGALYLVASVVDTIQNVNNLAKTAFLNNIENTHQTFDQHHALSMESAIAICRCSRQGQFVDGVWPPFRDAHGTHRGKNRRLHVQGYGTPSLLHVQKPKTSCAST